MDNKRNALIITSSALLVVILMFVAFALVALPETLSLEYSAESNPIEIKEEWTEIPSHPNRLPTYVWFVKVSETRNRVENIISYDEFKKKTDNNEIVRIAYVVEYNKVVFYGDEEISPTNIKFWKSVATPEQKFNGSVSFVEPTISESEIVYREHSSDIAWLQAIEVAITILFFAMILYMLYNIREIYNKDYEKEEEDEKEEDGETRR